MATIEEITNKSNDSLNSNQNKLVSPKKIFFLITYALLFLSICLAIIRTPFTGIYIDACFDYAFGKIIKYFWYLFILLSLFLTLFKKTRSWYFTTIKKTWFLIILIFFTSECIISCFWLKSLANQPNIQLNDLIIKNYHDFFYQNIANFGLDWINNFFQQPLTGGFVSAIWCGFLFVNTLYSLITFCGLLIIIFSLWLVFSTIKNGWILKVIKSNIIKKINKKLESDPIDEFVTSTSTLKLSQRKAKRKLKEKYSGNHLIDLLPTTEYDYSIQNKKKAMSYQKEIIKILKKQQITFFNGDIKCLPSFLEIIFSIKDEDIKKIENLKYDFLKIFQKNELNISIKGNTIGFKFSPYHSSPLTLHKYFQLLSSAKPFDIAIGITNDQQKPIKQNLLETKNVLLLGKKDSGSATALVAMITSLMFTSHDQLFDLFFVGMNIDIAYEKLSQCKLFNSKKIINLVEIKAFLKEINLEIDQRQNLVDSKIANSSLNPKIIVLPRLELTFKENDEMYNDLLRILKHGPSLNIYCFIQTRETNKLVMSQTFLKTLSHLYLFKIDSVAASNKLIGNDNATCLYNWGDCLALSPPLSNNYQHITTCYISRRELNYNLNILNVAYDSKVQKNI